MEDKVIKNHYAAEYIYNAYKNTKTCGVIEEDKAYGIKKIAEPIGLVAAVSRLKAFAEEVKGTGIRLVHENEAGIFGHSATNCE